MRYDYYAGEGFGIHARLATVNTQQWYIAMNINMTLLMKMMMLMMMMKTLIKLDDQHENQMEALNKIGKTLSKHSNAIARYLYRNYGTLALWHYCTMALW